MNILHLEDSDNDAELVDLLVRREWPNCQLHRVARRDEFQAALERGKFNLILSDYTLPGFDGLSALELARRQCPEKPFIFLSGTIGEERAVEALQRGASDYVIKDRPGRIVGAIRHALENVEARQHVRLRDERIREQAALLDKARDAICVLDADKRITYWNAGAEQLFGRSPNEVQGRELRTVLFAADPATYDEAVREVTARGEWQGELQPRTISGEILTMESSWSLVPAADGKSENFLIINTDVTARKKLQAQLLHAQRMDSIGTLAAGIAHDLNNALNPILVGANLLRSESLGTAAGELVDSIEAGAQHGAALIGQLLGFARGVDGVRLVLDPQQALGNLRQLLEPLLPRNIKLAVSGDKKPWPVRGDLTQLNQLLLNLCINARDAMPQGGRLEISAENATLDEAQAFVVLDGKPGQYVCFKVSDTGTGIPADIIDKIFDPFFTTKPLGKGIGLGLSSVRGIVKGHGGCLQVETEVGRGTTFRIFLPALPPSAAGAALVPAAHPQRHSGTSILLIDDDPAVRNILRMILERAGHRVYAVAGGFEGLAEFDRHSDQIELVITDIMMPEMSGPEVIAALRKRNPKLNAIAMSGLMDVSRAQIDRIEGPPIECLAKPVGSRALFAAIERVLHVAK